MPADDLDVFIVHGRDHELVQYFVEFFGSLGLSSGNAERLMATGRPQLEKVEYYLKQARFILVLVTFDEETPDAKGARPNVYIELQSSIGSGRAKDTVVLRETREDHLVDLGSDLAGRTVEVTFSRGSIHLALPAILRELRGHDLVRPLAASDHTFEAGKILNSFLDEMDEIWDKEFDVAWREIFQTSYDHESDFATTLDAFFQEYQAVFSALIRDKKRGSELKIIADRTLQNSWTLAARAWETVADAKRNLASQARSRRRSSPLYGDGLRLVATAKKERDPKRQIAMFRNGIEVLNKFINPRGTR